MDPAARVVTRLPLGELFDDRGAVVARRVASIGAEDVRERLRAGDARLMVASIGEPPRWLAPGDEAFELWKEELRPRLVEADQAARLEDFRDKRFWRASEWHAPGGEVILVFEEHH